MIGAFINNPSLLGSWVYVELKKRKVEAILNM